MADPNTTDILDRLRPWSEFDPHNPDCGGPNEALIKDAMDTIAQLRATVSTWCSGQLATNEQIKAAVEMVRDKINEDIITEVNDPRNAVEPPAFRQGLRVARIIVNRVIGE